MECLNGDLVKKKCPIGSYFEPIFKLCQVDENDPNNCAGYLKCIDEEFVEEKCPAGTYYDSKLETCTVDTEGVCVTIRKLCAEGLREKDPKDCAAYTQCIRGAVEILRCDSGRYFNATQAECLIDVDEVCVKSTVEYDKDLVQFRNSESTSGDLQETTNRDSTVADFSTELTSQNACIFDLNGDCVDQSTRCTEGKKQRDINNCAGYLKCIEGVFVKEECPDRTYYDYNSDECLIDVDKVCVKSRVEYEKDLLKLQYSVSTSGDLQEKLTSQNACIFDLNGDCVDQSTRCTEGKKQRDINNCAGYLKCIEGVFVKEECPDRTYYDYNLDECLIDVDKVTESSTSGSQTTRADLQFTTLDRDFNLENSTVTCVYNNTLVIEGIREVDPQDCAGYIECFGGEAKKLKCDSGRYFNVTQRECSIDVDEVCLKLDMTTTESTPNFTTTIDPYAKCSDGQRKLDPNNCAGFLKCVDGELHEETCPSGFFYNSTSKNCLVDIRATCVTNIKFCIEGVREEDPNNCAGYRQCISGVVQNLRCPFGQYFNVAERDCLNDVHQACARTEVDPNPDKVLHNDTGPPLTIPDESCILDINGACVDPLAKCTEGQVKLDPNNCAGYLKCKNGELIEELCPSGFYYDLQLMVCLVDRRGICVTNIQVCDEGAIEEDPYDCAGYRQCIGGQVAKLKCPFGSYFNLFVRDCLIDVDEICVRKEYNYVE
uniref:GG11518 n=1 Tax=Drosophila erecta TaxID=7220 RepID=B3P879_DROER